MAWRMPSKKRSGEPPDTRLGSWPERLSYLFLDPLDCIKQVIDVTVNSALLVGATEPLGNSLQELPVFVDSPFEESLHLL
jgi:hypothetical protein